MQILLKHKTNRIWLAGNGGSALTSQHLASDLSAIGFDASCLCENIARITALTNDYGFDDVYVRQLENINPQDALVAVSVHGGADSWSNNLVRAMEFAKGRGATTLSLTGFDGGRLAQICDFSIIVPAERTYIIEGIHSILTHVICQMLEEKRCSK